MKKNKTPKLGLLLGTFYAASALYGQSKDSSLNLLRPGILESIHPAALPLPNLRQFQVSGYYRFMANYRHLSESYPHLAAHPNNIFIGDDSQIPQLLLNLGGSIAPNTSFGTDLFLWTPMTGAGATEGVKGLNLGVNLHGTYAGDFGTFTLHTGGINWYALSPFTFQTNRGYNRFTLFERNPWDPNTSTLEARYKTYHSAGNFNQDQRWGQQAFHGMILEATGLPHGFSGVFMYGKTQLNGGLSPIPNNSFGGRISKQYGNNFASLNSFNSEAILDSLRGTRFGMNIHTLEFRQLAGSFLIKGEIGMGRTYTPDVRGKWGEAVSLKLEKKIASKLTGELHVYRISPRVVNNSSIFINSSYTEPEAGNTNTATQPVLPAVASAMTPIGQLVNNRQGADLNFLWDLGNIKAGFGWSMSGELERTSNRITYGHPVNNLALSRMWRWDFPANVGPYGNLSKIYRAVYETLILTEVEPGSGLPLKDKYFNSLEIHLRAAHELGRKRLYTNYLGQYSSAQTFLSPVTVFSEQALMRTYYHQLESYLVLGKGFTFCNYLGLERNIANYKTATDIVSRRPKNQTALAFATGFDLKLSKGAGLYVRQRWMKGHDSSFAKDRYQGFETSMELKIFF
jgi:hypothetical protein